MMNSDNPTPSSTTPSSSAVAWFCRSWKILLGSLVGTLIVNILCLPLWTDHDSSGLVRTPFNTKARMEIFYIGALTGADAFAITSSESSLSTSTNYSYRGGGQLYIADLPIEGEWKPYSFTLKVRNRGSIRISLKGPLENNDYGEIYSIPVDYRNLKIRAMGIFSDQRKVTHTKYFAHRLPVNANDTIRISFDVRRHHFDADDFHLFETKNFWYIITLSIFSFAVFYVLLQRVFAMWKMGKTEDWCFLFTFFSLLAVPLCDISDAQRSPREGRSLTPRPGVSLALKEGSNYGKRYDNWFSDHLGGRQQLIKMHDVIQRGTHRIIRGHTLWYMQEYGWLFPASFAWVPDLEHLNSIVTNISNLKLFCDENHIKFYVLMIPLKCSIYQEYLYGYGRNKRKGVLENAFHEQIKQLVKKQHVTYIYPWAELREACKRDYTFFQSASHWTDWGAYVGYRALMKNIHRDFPDMPVVSLGDYKRTRSSLIRDSWERAFGHSELKRHFNFEIVYSRSATLYNYYDHKNADKLVLNIGKFTKDFRYGGGAYKIMIIGTSQNDNLMNFLPYSAARTRYIRLNMGQLPNADAGKIMKYYKKDILSYKPDVLILSLYASVVNMQYIRDIFKQ